MRLLYLLPFVVMFAGSVNGLNAAEFIRPSSEILELEVGKGALLRLERPASTVFIADPNIADVQVKSARLIYLTAKRSGETSLYAVDSDERVIINRAISVSHNLSRLRTALRGLLPDTVIDVQSIDGTLILDGHVPTARDAEDARRLALRMVDSEVEILNKIDVTAPNQVNLRVQIAEVSRDVLKNFGVNWESAGRLGNFFYAPLFGRDFLVPDPKTGVDVIQRSRSNALGLGYDGGTQNLNTLIEALEERGLLTILAEPNLTTVSGETASFLAGGEFPIVMPTADQGKVAIEFKQFGVSLSFTPTILGEKRISLKVKPEVSQLSTEGSVEFNGLAIPSLTTRRASTTVELSSGQSFLIAGLIENNITRSISTLPGLGDIPILGALFRSDKFRREESELVIVATPYIVRPVSHRRLALPTDGLTPPTDIDRIMRGRTHRPSLSRRRQAPRSRGGGGLAGPAGFVLN